MTIPCIVIGPLTGEQLAAALASPEGTAAGVLIVPEELAHAEPRSDGDVFLNELIKIMREPLGG